TLQPTFFSYRNIMSPEYCSIFDFSDQLTLVICPLSPKKADPLLSTQFHDAEGGNATKNQK
ncbi:hypothetical protein ILUMI_17497, partial [Ignelater luminosus]